MTNYLLLSSTGFTLLIVFYYVIHKQDTFFYQNRALLLLGSIFCICLPLFENEVVSDKVILLEDITTSIRLPNLTINNQEKEVSIEQSIESYQDIILDLYFSIVFILSLKFLFSNYQLISFIQRNEVIRHSKYSLVLTEGELPTFAYLKYIFWNNKKELSDADLKLILLHEKAHIEEWHFADIFLMEILKIVFWFLPSIYFIDHALRAQHEFLADRKVHLKSDDGSLYSQLLVNSLFNVSPINIGNGFQFSTIKSRIKMLHKKPTHQLKRAASIFTFSILFISITLLQACLQNEETVNFNDISSQENIYAYSLGEKTYWDVENKIQLDDFFINTEVTQTLVIDNNKLPTNIKGKVNKAILIAFREDFRYDIIDKIKKLPSTNHQYIADPLKINIRRRSIVETNTTDTVDIYKSVEHSAQYPGGLHRLYQRIERSLVYPNFAKENGIEGKVILQFTINKEGNGENFKILNDANELFSDEVLRIAPTILQGWIPANHQGIIVKQELELPITFKL